MRLLLWGSLLVMLFVQCSTSSSSDISKEQLVITTTTGMIADAVKNIVGDSAQVMALMGPGTDPHLYKATQGDLAKINQSDIIVYNGLHLEGKMSEVFEKLSSKKTTYAIATVLPHAELINSSGYADAFDPHIWFDVSLWAQAVQGLGDFLAENQPALADYFQENTERYLRSLQELHNKTAKRIAEIPQERRVLITAHDAFEYFGRAYDIEVRGLQGISTASEPGMADRVELTNYIVEHGIKAVFVESSVPEKALRAVVEGVESKGHQVQIGGTLYSDAMGAEGSGADTYIGMVNQNVNTIVNSLR